MTQEVSEKYDQPILNLDKTDPTYIARKCSSESRREKDLDSRKSMTEHRKRQGKKRVFHKIDEKIDNAAKSRTTKMIVDFCAEEAVFFKSFAITEKEKVQVTTRFLSGKMLMFAKFSLMSFTCEMPETFCFPDEKVKEIYNKYLIEEVYMYHELTDTDSTCLQFLFISDSKSNISEQKYREIIFEVIVASEIYNKI